MAKKKELDKLSQEMIQCEKDGFGVNYGRWKATQTQVNTYQKFIPESTITCPECGAYIFHPRHNQVYCCFDCQRRAVDRRMNQKKKEKQNESNA